MYPVHFMVLFIYLSQDQRRNQIVSSNQEHVYFTLNYNKLLYLKEAGMLYGYCHNHVFCHGLSFCVHINEHILFMDLLDIFAWE